MESATKDGVHTWTFGDQLWQQTPDGRFSLHSIAGVKTSDTRIDLDYLAGARLAPDSSSHYLPAAFHFCPQSGARLPETAWDAQNRWLPPYGDGSGSRVIADGELSAAQRTVAAIFQRYQASGSRKLSDDMTTVDIQALGKSGLNFFVADAGGFRDALFALGRNGALHLWLRNAGKWQQLQPEGSPIGRVELEKWAWSVSLVPGRRGHDLLIPAESGAVLVSIDPLSGKYRCQRYQGTSLGGAGLLAGDYWLPLRMADGSVQLVGRSGDDWEILPVSDQIPTSVELLSAPVSDPATGRLLWIGAAGYLSLSQDGFKPHWQPWPNGATAEPQMGPPFRDGSGLWQLISEPEGNDYYVQLDSRATDRSDPIKGSRLSTGHLSFKYNVRLDIPWNEDQDPDRNPIDGKVVYPFIEFRTGKYLLSVRNQQEQVVKDFFASTEALHVHYCLDEIDGIRLSLSAVAREPWKAQWFFFDNAMWLYIDSLGALYRWNA